MNAFLLERGVSGVGGVGLESVASTTLGNCTIGNYGRKGGREGGREGGRGRGRSV